MTPAQWESVKGLFHQALDRPGDGRGEWLARQCVGESEVRAEVERLIAAHLAAGSFIEKPAADLHPDPHPPRVRVGTWMGQYRLDALLGAGGMGEVYRAVDTELGRDVAIKVVRCDESAAHDRLRREARHASHLNHQNICTIHHVGDDDGQPYIVMEIVEGRPLSELITPGGVPTATAVSYALQVLDALIHAHDHRVVHRDLKSANVMVKPDGQLKLLDFGLARQLDCVQAGAPAFSASTAECLTAAGGTLPYMAPEILRGETADARTDLWAFGVLLYELITGRLPFSGQTPLETGSAILNDAPEPLPASVPQAVAACVMACLEKRPDDRPQHAADVKAQLEASQRRGASRSSTSSRRIAATAVVAIVSLTTIAFATRHWRPAAAATLARPIESIAVLPLENVSGDPSQDYFADGVTESLIGELRKMGGLRVSSRTTVMRYRGSRKPLPELARELDVDAIIRASVLRQGGAVRIAATLLRRADERLWTDTLERPAREILALQRDIVLSAASHISVAFARQETDRLSRQRSVAPDVYESYLKGRYYWNKRSQESLAAAVQHFQAAVDADPTYAPAHVGLADCYNQLGTVMVAGGSPAQMRPKAAAAAIAALQIDPGLAEAHAALGYVRHYDWQWEAAERSLRHAIELDSNNALVHLWYANYLVSLRRLDEAVVHVETAKQLDPLSPVVMTNVGWTMAYAGRPHDAVVAYREALALDPQYVQAHMRLASVHAELAQFTAAFAEHELAADLMGRSPASLIGMANTLVMAGRPHEAERTLEQILARAGSEYLPPFALAQPYLRLGQYDRAFDWLERAYQERSNGMVYLAVESVYAPVRSHPRYQDLLRRVGLVRPPD